MARVRIKNLHRPFLPQEHDAYHRKMLNKMANQFSRQPELNKLSWIIRSEITPDIQQQYINCQWQIFQIIGLAFAESISVFFIAKFEWIKWKLIGIDGVNLINAFFGTLLTIIILLCIRNAYQRWQIIKLLKPKINQRYIEINHTLNFKKRQYVSYHALSENKIQIPFHQLNELPPIPTLSKYTELEQKMCAFIKHNIQQRIR